jgi:dTDP-4-dehydrorhamnose 3,5-epimerase
MKSATGPEVDSLLAPSPDLEVSPPAERDRPTTSPDGTPYESGLHGVVHQRLQRLSDHRGSLIEAVHPNNSFWREPVHHCEYVTIRPGRIKGWGMHKLSDDRYVVADGKIRVVLYDGRVRSPTFDRIVEFHFTAESPGLLRIPAGVWHANHNWGDTEATFLVFPTRPYDHANPDKYRLDPIDGPIPFDWTLREG